MEEITGGLARDEGGNPLRPRLPSRLIFLWEEGRAGSKGPRAKKQFPTIKKKNRSMGGGWATICRASARPRHCFREGRSGRGTVSVGGGGRKKTAAPTRKGSIRGASQFVEDWGGRVF